MVFNHFPFFQIFQHYKLRNGFREKQKKKMHSFSTKHMMDTPNSKKIRMIFKINPKNKETQHPDQSIKQSIDGSLVHFFLEFSKRLGEKIQKNQRSPSLLTATHIQQRHQTVISRQLTPQAGNLACQRVRLPLNILQFPLLLHRFLRHYRFILF